MKSQAKRKDEFGGKMQKGENSGEVGTVAIK
jgi:hypothetical protein